MRKLCGTIASMASVASCLAMQGAIASSLPAAFGASAQRFIDAATADDWHSSVRRKHDGIPSLAASRSRETGPNA